MSAINKMSNKKVTMMKLRRIIQMLSEGYSQNEICRETSSSKTTVSGYKKMADGTKLSYRELLLMEDSELEALLQPKLAALPPDPRKAELEALMPEVMKRLSKRYATVELVHQDFYLKQCPGGYGYTQFNKHVKAWREAHDLSYHNVYIAGEQWQIDFAGDSLWLTSRRTGELTKVVVLVCVMPYSELPFLMALPDATTDWFFHGLNKGLEFMGALPKMAGVYGCTAEDCQERQHEAVGGQVRPLLPLTVGCLHGVGQPLPHRHHRLPREEAGGQGPGRVGRQPALPVRLCPHPVRGVLYAR